MTDSQHTMHSSLARSYFAYFLGSIIGLFVDTMIGYEIPPSLHAQITAFVCFGVGAVLVVWAQYTSRRGMHTAGTQTKPYFFRGPYRYMRNPTHLGIVLLVTGYTVVSGSLAFFAVTVIGYFISNIFFHKYEAALYETYDGAYEDYKQDVPKIL